MQHPKVHALVAPVAAPEREDWVDLVWSVAYFVVVGVLFVVLGDLTMRALVRKSFKYNEASLDDTIASAAERVGFSPSENEWLEVLTVQIVPIVFGILAIVSVWCQSKRVARFAALCRVFGTMYLLKAVIQYVTIMPSPTVTTCLRNNGIRTANAELSMMRMWSFHSCADMMFSGHTAFTFITVYVTTWPTWLKAMCVVLEALGLVLSQAHYSSDVMVGAIVAWFLCHMLYLHRFSLPIDLREVKSMGLLV